MSHGDHICELEDPTPYELFSIAYLKIVAKKVWCPRLFTALLFWNNAKRPPSKFGKILHWF